MTRHLATIAFLAGLALMLGLLVFFFDAETHIFSTEALRP